MENRFSPICVVGILVSSIFAPQGDARISGIVSVEQIARLTGIEGSDSINPTWEVGIGGVDLGHMANFEGKVFFFYGDSFSSDLAYWPGVPGTGEGWRWNTVSISTDMDPSDGITFNEWITGANPNWAREIIRDERQNPITNIPTGAIGVGERLYVWYMSMKNWNPWNNHFSGLAYSENGRDFSIVSTFQFPNNDAGGNFGMVAPALSTEDPNVGDEYVYLWGTPAHRFGGVKLARVRPNNVSTLSLYEYFGGLVEGYPIWISSEFQSPLIVPARVGEMSVMYNRWAGRWIMMHNMIRPDQPTWSAGDIVLRHASDPWGPWSDAITVVPLNTKTLPYGPYMNPLYVENEGESVYFTLSLWDPYDVYWMKMTLTDRPHYWMLH